MISEGNVRDRVVLKAASGAISNVELWYQEVTLPPHFIEDLREQKYGYIFPYTDISTQNYVLATATEASISLNFKGVLKRLSVLDALSSTTASITIGQADISYFTLKIDNDTIFDVPAANEQKLQAISQLYTHSRGTLATYQSEGIFTIDLCDSFKEENVEHFTGGLCLSADNSCLATIYHTGKSLPKSAQKAG
jgi:hypothetical protein